MSKAASSNRQPQSGSAPPPELYADYVDESHIKAFEEALQADDLPPELQEGFGNGTDSPVSPGGGGTHTPSGHRVRKVSALSDFAPVNVRVNRYAILCAVCSSSDIPSRRRRRPSHTHKSREWLFVLVRWPLLLIIFFFIGFEFSMYVLIRQLVNGKEWLSAWRGRKGLLRKRLRESKTYQEWKDAALALDEYMHFDEWKHADEDPYYDWRLVRKVLRSLKTHRERNDSRALMEVLETCVRTNFAGIESSRLYSETFYGTKDLIETYITELERALEFIRNTPDISPEEKRRFFKSCNTNLGTTALSLSGGATFGYYHFGVVKAFLDEDLLPRVISGTSAGGLVAALVCTRTDAELKRLLVPELANRITACRDPISVWLKRFWRTGARFDSIDWARKCTFFTRGSMTFKEAYLRTGRILNISVVPADRHSPTKLLNYMTAPDTVIWSALLASAAVPGILNPVVLMQKTRDGTLVPWNWGSKFKDGSLRVDIPVQALNLYFNVTNTIVSQVNPHVHLFFFAPRGSAGKPVAHSKGKGWRGNFLLSAAEQWLKLELTKNFKLIRDLDLLPQVLGQDWSSVFVQRFEGTVTIWPRTRFQDWIHILDDPDPVELARKMRVGQLVTWPKLHIIENRYRLEKQILQGRQAVRRALHPRSRDRTGEQFPTPVTGTKLDSAPMLGRTSLSPDPPPMDSEVESMYLNGRIGPQAHRHHHQRKDSPGSPGSSNRASIRRRWSVVADEGEAADVEPTPQTDYGRATPDPPPPETEVEEQSDHPPHPPSSPSSLLRRLRTVSANFSPFATLRRNGKPPTPQELNPPEAPWSGDSSSDDDDLSVASRTGRRLRHPSIMGDWGDTGEEFDVDSNEAR
ncbi:patatin-domain-containing protein [Panus rudis PR-1116 ss-1]|nr:patatin-domain-containing protein [Panus rudis PR-1116 ss-1]